MDNVMNDATLIEAVLQKVFTMQEDQPKLKGISMVCIREDETIFAVHNCYVFDAHSMALALIEAAEGVKKRGQAHAN